jgi:diacylglycerol kinase
MKDTKSDNNKISIKKRAKSFKYAFDGISYMVKSQHNAWIHLLLTILVVIAAWIFEVSVTEWCFLIFAIGFVLTAEAFNTAIEELTNLVSPEFNKKAGLVKDVSAGAVFIAAIVAAIIGSIIFLPKIILLF